MGGIAEFFPGNGDFSIGGAAIKQNDGAATVLQLLGPDFGVAILTDAAALHAELILIDGDDFLVGEDFLDLRSHVLQIISSHQGSGEKTPEAEVRAVFRTGHATVADLEHVELIPVAGTGVGFQANLHVENLGPAELVFLAGPAIGAVDGSAQEIHDYLSS